MTIDTSNLIKLHDAKWRKAQKYEPGGKHFYEKTAFQLLCDDEREIDRLYHQLIRSGLSFAEARRRLGMKG